VRPGGKLIVFERRSRADPLAEMEPETRIPCAQKCGFNERTVRQTTKIAASTTSKPRRAFQFGTGDLTSLASPPFTVTFGIVSLQVHLCARNAIITHAPARGVEKNQKPRCGPLRAPFRLRRWRQAACAEQQFFDTVTSLLAELSTKSGV
jgi:hypothetical protein